MAVAQKTRYRWLDLLRGAAVVNMVAFHFCYDWFEVFARQPGWYFLWPIRLWQQAICCTFILTAGFSACLGRRALRHGLVLNLCGFTVSAVTLLALPAEAVRFGVLNLLGCGVLLAWALRPALEKLPAWAGLLGCALLFIVTREINSGYLGFGGWVIAELPGTLYRDFVMTFLGFPGPGFYSTDYFSLFPWLFLYGAGYFLQKLTGRERMEPLRRSVCPPLGWMGRHSLLLYLLHQPALYGALTALSLLTRQLG